MFSRSATILIPVLVGALGLATDARAQENGAGVTLKAYYPADAACLVGANYGGLQNTCPRAVFVVDALSVPPGNHNTYVWLFGNNSFCQTASLGTTGLPVHLGAETWTVSGPLHWQQLMTGVRFVSSATPVTFLCKLEPNGYIGTFAAE